MAVSIINGLIDPDFNLRLQIHLPCTIGSQDFIGVRKDHPLTLGINPVAGHVIQSKNNVLRWNDDRLTVGWRQHVIGRHHQSARFELCFERQRQVNSHLVTVKVGVVGRTD